MRVRKSLVVQKERKGEFKKKQRMLKKFVLKASIWSNIKLIRRVREQQSCLWHIFYQMDIFY